MEPRIEDTDGGEGRRDHNEDRDDDDGDDGDDDSASLDGKKLLPLGIGTFIVGEVRDPCVLGEPRDIDGNDNEGRQPRVPVLDGDDADDADDGADELNPRIGRFGRVGRVGQFVGRSLFAALNIDGLIDTVGI